MGLFMYPVALLVTMLLRKYSPADLGARFYGFLPALLVYGITAATALILVPHSFTWHEVLAECGGNVWGVLASGLFLAALPEEFLRMMLQTRWGAAMNNKAMGWLAASVIWGLMHVPHWYQADKDIVESILSGIRIVPLGLMWGYLTHRTKSILPSVLIHANNYWGLQNF